MKAAKLRMNFAVSATTCALLCAPVVDVSAADASALAAKHNCLACHTVDKKVVGPSYKEIAQKYAGDKSASKTLEGKVKAGSTGVWGPVPMPPNNIPDADNKALVAWILSLK